MSQYSKHYLITGGAGFIGSNLIRAVVKDETIRITCIDNFDSFYPRQHKLLNTDGFEKFLQIVMIDLSLDSLTTIELKKIIPEPVDVIIHLAAKAGVRPSISNPLAYQKTNVLGTQMLLDFAKENK